MRELLEQGAVEELSALKVERDRLRERLARLEGLQGDVDPRVAQRVAADYRQRLAEVDRRAQPLLERARQAYATLRGRLEELAQRHESIRLDREEIELRHRLGEFDDQARRERLAAIESALAEAQAARSEGEALRERFLAAVDEEAVLLVATPSASSVPRPAETARPTETARPAETARPTEPRTQPIRVVQPAPDAGKPPTRPMPTVERETRPAATGATVMLKPARLVPQTREAGRVPVPLVLRNYRVGSGEQNDIRVGDAEIAPHQADILVGPEGYTVADQARNGRTRVNGEAVERRLLRDGDAVEFGKARFLYREG